MLEIEQKYRARDWTIPLARLVHLAAVPLGPRTEADHYFNAPDRDFAATNEALRLRRVGESCIITYKGPRHAGPVKTRAEIEVPLVDGLGPFEDMRKVFLALGYRPVAVVSKMRDQFELHRGGFDLNVCFDDVTGVGRFIEVEIVTDEAQKAEAERVLQVVAGELGLMDPEPRSYLRMLLEKSR